MGVSNDVRRGPGDTQPGDEWGEGGCSPPISKTCWMQKEFDVLCVPPEGNGPGPVWECRVPEKQTCPGIGLCIFLHLLTARLY